MHCEEPVYGVGTGCAIIFGEREDILRTGKKCLSKSGDSLFNSHSVVLCMECTNTFSGASTAGRENVSHE